MITFLPGRVSLQPTNAVKVGNFQARTIIDILYNMIILLLLLLFVCWARPGVDATHQCARRGQHPGPYYHYYIILYYYHYYTYHYLLLYVALARRGQRLCPHCCLRYHFYIAREIENVFRDAGVCFGVCVWGGSRFVCVGGAEQIQPAGAGGGGGGGGGGGEGRYGEDYVETVMLDQARCVCVCVC